MTLLPLLPAHPPTHTPFFASLALYLQHVVYNQVDPSVRNSYTRPADIDDKTWKKVSETQVDSVKKSKLPRLPGPLRSGFIKPASIGTPPI